MTVDCISAGDDIERLRALEPEWRRLAESDPHAHIALSFPLLLANAAHRLSAEQWYCYIARDGEDLSNSLFGYRSRLGRALWGVPMLRMGVEYLSDPLDAAPGGRDALRLLVSRVMRDHRDCAIFEFGHLRESAMVAMQAVANELGLRYCADPNGNACTFDTAQSLSQFMSGLGARTRRNLRRERRRLERRWPIELEVVESGEIGVNLSQLQQFSDLESLGWKGREGGAIASNKKLRDYYRCLIEKSGPAQSFIWYVLKADARPIAMYMCIRSQDTVWAPKTAYDESFAAYSPGGELLFRIIEQLIEDPAVRRLHMITGAQWLTNWRPLSEAHFRLRLFSRSPAGRLSHLADRLRRSRAARALSRLIAK